MEQEPFLAIPYDNNNNERVILLNKIIFYGNFIFISITYMKPVLHDSQKLLSDAAETLSDFGELIPEVNESLAILKTLCNSKHSPIHKWCQIDNNFFYDTCNSTIS